MLHKTGKSSTKGSSKWFSLCETPPMMTWLRMIHQDRNSISLLSWTRWSQEVSLNLNISVSLWMWFMLTGLSLQHIFCLVLLPTSTAPPPRWANQNLFLPFRKEIGKNVRLGKPDQWHNWDYSPSYHSKFLFMSFHSYCWLGRNMI